MPYQQPSPYPGYGQQPARGGVKPRTWIIIAIVAVVVVGGGITGVVLGLGGGGGGSQATAGAAGGGGSAVTTNQGFGDLNTLDPCSFVTAKSFQSTALPSKSGKPLLSIIPISLDGCEVEIAVKPTGAAATVDVNFSETLPELHVNQSNVASTTTKNGMSIVKFTAQGSPECDQDVVLTNKNAFNIVSRPDVVPGGATTQLGQTMLCQLADTMVNDITSAPASGDIKHIQYPQGSMGAVQPCSLTSTSNVGSTLQNADGLHAYTSTDGHDCNWQVGPDSSSPDGTSSAYFYTQTYDGTMPQADPSQGVNVSAIAGHNSLVIPQGTDGSIASCSVETSAKKWTFPGEWKGNVVSIDNDIPFVIEYPTINTHVVGDQNAACQAATGLASQIWSKIP